ncbi:TNT domain-containing protein [Cellulomonas xylanilytica]|uniref:TNT domain-containing protein n=1 Tax=Cellulomonas xylanilytica TaxID=233583 RepID=A0A510V8R7_9CELL|nr:TNT domain-containing protein [Cellulomonas xylanilytica]GEK23166.1 hypothetical protein CXY01_36860 [Cellulomonas xylanilytica]
MSKLVEINPEALGAVRNDIAATRDAIRDELGPLRRRMSNLDVPTGAMLDVLAVADRLDSDVLPTLDWHVARGRELATMRYGGTMGTLLAVVDVDGPFGPPPDPFAQRRLEDGSTALTWPAAPAEEQDADRQDAESSEPIASWFEDRWDDLATSVDDGTTWLSQKATDAWDDVTEAGEQLGDWWERTTGDLGEWIDDNLADLRELIGKHAAVFRFLADACRVVGWVVVAFGVVLTVALAAIGATGGSAFGAVFGVGVGAVPAGGAGALAGASVGLKVTGLGFAMVSVGDFLDVTADWGEGDIDGQDLVKQGSLEIALALGSLIGFGAVGKMLQKTYGHLPDSWATRVDDLLEPHSVGDGSVLGDATLGPLHNGYPSGPGWTRQPDIEPDAAYGHARPDVATLSSRNQVPSTINSEIRRIGGDLADPWGIDPDTGSPFTEAEWTRRFTTAGGGVRWPPNRGAVSGTRVQFTDADRFVDSYGEKFDRVGRPSGAFLGIPPGASFGSRALPPSTLDESLTSYTFNRRALPPDVTIEVSQIAPAFGRPGGALQVRFIKDGKAVTVEELVGWGVLS